jgi:hypothetical protein
MRYSDLFKLNSIKTVIQINEADDSNKAKRLVETFVVTESLGEMITHVALPQLDFNSGAEGKGIFMVGNYGTGKSHVMGFLSIIAENADYLQYVRDADYKQKLSVFAGKYKVRRHQIAGSLMSLYDIITEQLSILAKKEGFSFNFKLATQVSDIKTEFQRFMEEFEKHFPGMGVLLITDELLDYLRSRNDLDLVHDLSVLRSLGEFCESSRFVFMAGVQQSLFNNPRFQHVAEELNRVKKRFYDFSIDSKGVSELVEQYLFEKTADQKKQIRLLFEKQFKLYENLAPEIDRFVALFPAHPRFIDEFQRVFVVERREILTQLSKEGEALLNKEVEANALDLITSDKYWKDIEDDQGLRANREIAKVIQNVSTITAHMRSNFGTNDDLVGATRLIYALAVNRLTTDSINAQVGLTPEELKNNLLWNTPIAMADPQFLTGAAKRLLDRSREVANGQFLSVSKESGQYYIDPTKVTDYEQQVVTYSKTLSENVVQRYLNEIFTRALEMDNDSPVQEGRLWNYNLQWTDKNVERPGWLFFGFPNQRSTAKPPKDFYLFIIPSKRVSSYGKDEKWQDCSDENYWFLEDFPPANCDNPNQTSSDDSNATFLDQLRIYVSAREREHECRGEEQAAYRRIADRELKKLLPEFVEHAGDWVSIQWNGQKKRFGEWVAEFAPTFQTALFKTRVNAICQVMFSPHFAAKYPGYPVFSATIQESTRQQAMQTALEIICSHGMRTGLGRAVLEGLELYKDDAPTPENSPWLQSVRNMLNARDENQVLNNIDLFESREERVWMKGDCIEAEWLHVILAAGVEAGYFNIIGKNNTKYDAANMREFFMNVKTWEGIIRVGRPVGPPIEKWRKLFKIFKLNQGLLANSNTHKTAIEEFQAVIAKKILQLVQDSNPTQWQLAFLEEEDKASVYDRLKVFTDAKTILEDNLTSLNSVARMANLRMEMTEIDELESLLKECVALEAMFAFVTDKKTGRQLHAIERYETILADDINFQQKLIVLKERMKQVYFNPVIFTDKPQTIALEQLIFDTIDFALNTYQRIQREHSLDKDGDNRKKKILQGDTLQRLNKLVLITAVNKDALEELRKGLDNLPIYHVCTNEELLNSPTSLNPYTKFDPRILTMKDRPANEILAECEEKIYRLENDWTKQLLKELDDPAIIPTLTALKPEEKKIVEDFVSSQQLPTQIADAFVNVMNTALRGLKRRPVKANDFAKQVMGDGTVPLKAEEMRQRFEKWLKDQLGADQPETVRFVLED